MNEEKENKLEYIKDIIDLVKTSMDLFVSVVKNIKSIFKKKNGRTIRNNKTNIYTRK